jgi:hypothetical protein
VNDHPKCLKYSNVTIYADDTSQDVTDKSVDIIETKLICDLKTPILLGFDITPFHPTLCSLLDKYDLNHETVFSHTKRFQFMD